MRQVYKSTIAIYTEYSNVQAIVASFHSFVQLIMDDLTLSHGAGFDRVKLSMHPVVTLISARLADLSGTHIASFSEFRDKQFEICKEMS